MNHDQLKRLVPDDGQGYDWKDCVALIPRLARLEETPQDPVYHAEGNVGTHTRMVLDALLQDPGFIDADEARRFVLFFAALLHDIAKPETTVIDRVGGRISQPGHSRRGAVDARILLWQAGVPFTLRERICRIIDVHQLPFFAFASRRGDSPQWLVHKLSWELALPELVCVARCDMAGRRYQGQADCLQDIALFEELAREEGCWDGPRAYVDAHTRLAYCRAAQGHPDHARFQLPGSAVTVMCGLPASGKDSWVRVHRPGLPVVSFDDAKAELGLKHGENDGKAAHHAVDKARALLRQGAPFVWNATHLSRQMRDKTLDLLWAYHAEIELVYLEQAREVVMARNAQRDTSLSNAALERMLHRWELPLPTEAHRVDYQVA
ncbi:AAA family ATPase [Aquabacterium sp. A7-Y]|uniref:AAA family ATPase n=1 Tax=Aquabacterium sp. A7-Y TaxID=1349605 RepID=UPI00223D9153|nr:AAA family ATPase [Aquabacterium sp. A7-Y]MCW7539958.1 AAA family ATPase [Aquabacterium sp. A7-Y]